jgi:hypothetical protein
MMRMLLAMIISLNLVWSPAALASSQTALPAASAADPRALAEKAMKYLASNDLKGMFKYIETIMPIEKAELDKIRDTSITQRKVLPTTLGAYVGYAFINECRKSDFISRLIFVEKRAKNFIRWEFVFYKPRDKWQISAFYWDTKSAEVFAAC